MPDFEDFVGITYEEYLKECKDFEEDMKTNPWKDDKEDN